MLIPSLTSPRPKLIPVPAIWAPKSNLGLILKERSFMDRGPMLMFTTVDFFLVAGRTPAPTGTDDFAEVSASVLVGIRTKSLVAFCLVDLIFIV